MHCRRRALDLLDAFAELSEKGVFRAGPGMLCRPIGRDDRTPNPLARLVKIALLQQVP